MSKKNTHLKKLPLWAKIFIGMGIGIIWGLVAVWTSLENFTLDWIKPWGMVFLKLLKLIAVPLIFVSLVKGISSLSNIARLSRIGLKTIGIYILTTLIATFLGLGLVNLMKPGNVFPAERQAEFRERYMNDVSEKQLFADDVKDQSPLRFLEDIIPDNIVFAAGDNSKMLQVIFFAILFGIAMVMIPGDKVKVVKGFFDGLNEIILRIIDIIMQFAPYGVLALMAGLIVDFSGDSDLFSALGLYIITVVLGLFLLILFFYPSLMRIFARKTVREFFSAILPAQLVAFSTSSSAATLPVTLKQTISGLKVPRTIANFVLPVGVTINMDGTSCYQAIAAVFIAQVFGIDLTVSQQLTIVLLATAASIGSPGVPGGSIVMLIVVLSSVGLPPEGLALILGVDRPIDMLRTVVNITGDSTVASIVARTEQGLEDDEESQE